MAEKIERMPVDENSCGAASEAGGLLLRHWPEMDAKARATTGTGRLLRHLLWLVFRKMWLAWSFIIRQIAIRAIGAAIPERKNLPSSG